jgi:hypothetical protein
MRHPWAVALPLTVLGCGTQASPPPSVTPSLSIEPAPAVARAASDRPEGDPPLDCVDAPPEHRLAEGLSDTPGAAHTKAAINAIYPQLTRCAVQLAKPGALRIHVRGGKPGSVPEEVTVRLSSIDDCRAVACVTQVFAATPLPGTSQGTVSFTRDLALDPRSLPEPARRVNWDQEETTSRCVHEPKQPPTPSGRLPPEQIQSVVRARYDAFRKCYEAGLARDPGLRGRVTTRFLIDAHGRVSMAHIAGNELTDCEVTACMIEELKKCVFPEPEGGVVTVVYPLVFEPG